MGAYLGSKIEGFLFDPLLRYIFFPAAGQAEAFDIYQRIRSQAREITKAAQSPHMTLAASAKGADDFASVSSGITPITTVVPRM